MCCSAGWRASANCAGITSRSTASRGAAPSRAPPAKPPAAPGRPAAPTLVGSGRLGRPAKGAKVDTADGQDAPRVLPLPVGITATGTRTERDSLGAVEVPADHYWGAQTQRSLTYFNIGGDVMPAAVYHAYGLVKKACARVNGRQGRLPPWKAVHPRAGRRRGDLRRAG